MGKLLFIPSTTLDIPIARVLDAARESLAEGMVLGVDAEGCPYFASSTGDKGTLLLWMELFKADLVAGRFDPEEDS